MSITHCEEIYNLSFADITDAFNWQTPVYCFIEHMYVFENVKMQNHVVNLFILAFDIKVDWAGNVSYNIFLIDIISY